MRHDRTTPPEVLSIIRRSSLRSRADGDPGLCRVAMTRLGWRLRPNKRAERFGSVGCACSCGALRRARRGRSLDHRFLAAFVVEGLGPGAYLALVDHSL